MKKKIILSIILIVLMIIVDTLINPSYLIKSIIKVVLFLLIPMVLGEFKRIEALCFFRISNKKSLLKTLGIGIFVYLGIIFSYFILSSFIDLEIIKSILENSLKVNRGNFILVAVYISFINSFIEEFFFRGYLFLDLLKYKGRGFAYVYSALVFSIYHVGIMGGWFNPVIFILALLGLFTGGLIFNYLNEKNRNILNSYMVHMMANLAINTIGLMMFDII